MSKLKMYIPSGDELLKHFVHFVKDNIFGAALCINKQRGTLTLGKKDHQKTSLTSHVTNPYSYNNSRITNLTHDPGNLPFHIFFLSGHQIPSQFSLRKRLKDKLLLTHSSVNGHISGDLYMNIRFETKTIIRSTVPPGQLHTHKHLKKVPWLRLCN